MNKEIAVKVEGLGKKYQIGEKRKSYSTLRDAISEGVSRTLKSINPRSTAKEKNGNGTIWALKDVSFEIRQGEVVGIIGRNGAGKSTLLKTLARITEPTTGVIDIYGRVGSLLEVGTGFHPELSGRENIYLSGSILGMKKQEIDRQFDEIVDFAEVEKFIETPVKHYSSGMYLRLAFGVAAHLQPEILLVDEVLAVGDAVFQKKCLGKMGDVAKQGRTVMFVSHNMSAVKSLCQRGILIEDGQVAFDGRGDDCINEYFKRINKMQGKTSSTSYNGSNGEIAGNDKIKVSKLAIYAQDKPIEESILTSNDIVFEVEFYNNLDRAIIDVTLDLHNLQGIHVAHIGTICDLNGLAKGWYKTKGILPGNILNVDRYVFSVQFGRNQRELLFRMEEILTFDVDDGIQNRGSKYARLPGVIHPLCQWSTEPKAENGLTEHDQDYD